jgi:transcriptional regulator with XRE-family HTH domain
MDRVDLNILGKNLEKARRQAGFSQESVGAYLGVDQGLISKYENGERAITSDALDRLADLFGCSVGYFFGEDKNTALKGIAFRGSGIKGEDLKLVAKMNRILMNLREMEQLLEEVKS